MCPYPPFPEPVIARNLDREPIRSGHGPSAPLPGRGGDSPLSRSYRSGDNSTAASIARRVRPAIWGPSLHMPNASRPLPLLGDNALARISGHYGRELGGNLKRRSQLGVSEWQRRRASWGVTCSCRYIAWQTGYGNRSSLIGSDRGQDLRRFHTG